MKKVLSVLFAIIILCMGVIPSYAANPKISVKTVSSASVGDTITVSVNLSANSELAGLKFIITFDNSYFEYISNSASVKGVFDMEEAYKDSRGVVYGGVDNGVVNKGATLISLKFKILKTGGKISISNIDACNGSFIDVSSSISVSSTTVKCSHAKAKWVVTKKATCTSKGTETRTCVCGDVSTRDIPIEHKLGQFTVIKEPTCTEKGEKTATCSVCNTKVTEPVSAKGHTYGKWTVEKEATETEKGLKWAKCTVCGEKKEQVINKLKPTETTTETTTFVENTTESTTNEPTTAPTPQIVEKTSTAEIVAKTVAVVLGVEALGLVIFLICKKKKENK